MTIIQSSKGIYNSATGKQVVRPPSSKTSLSTTISNSLVPPAPTTAPAPQMQPIANTMTIPQGATLTSLAQQNNTNVQELLKLNPQIQNPDLIFAGSKLTLPGQPTPTAPTAPAVVDPKQIAEEANNRASQIYSQIEKKEVTERGSSELIRNAIQSLANAPRPEKPKSMMDLYTETKQSLGLDPLETRLAEIDSEIERLNVGALVDQERAGDRPVGQRQIDLRKNTIGKEAQLQTALLQTERSAVARLAENKLSSLKMIMDFTQTDYQNASKYYNEEYNRNMDMLNLFVKLEDREIAAEDREIAKEDRATQLQRQAKNDAQAQLTTMSNLLKTSGKTFGDLSPDQMRNITQWEMEAGFPVGTYEAFGSVKPSAKILSTSSGTDAQGNGVVTFIYEDPENPGRPGVVEIVKTGSQATLKGGGGGGDEPVKPMTATERKEFTGTYGWTPPMGISLEKALQIMKDNPGVSPEILQKEVTAFVSGQEVEQLTVEDVREDILKNLKPEEIKQFHTKSKEVGVASMWTGKKSDVKRLMNQDVITEVIERLIKNGKSIEDIKKILLIRGTPIE